MKFFDFCRTRGRCRFLFHLTAAIGCFCGAATLAAEAKEPEPATSFELPSWVFDRGNAIVVATSDSGWHYQEKWPDLLVGGGSESPWYVEYDIDLPVEATWTLHVRYMADEPRPLELWFDGRRVGTCCTSDTKTPTRLTPNPHYKEMEWHPQPPRLQWEKAAALEISKGKHTIKLICEGPPPGVATLRLDSSKPFSKDWLTGPGIQLPVERRELIARMAHGRQPAWKPVGQLEKIDRLPPIYRTQSENAISATFG